MANNIEGRVARHYAQGNLEERILAALAASGKDPEQLTADDLAPVDEFHTGGRQGTEAFATQFKFTPDMHVLDVGCGIGGPSRYIARTHGCRITGIDLTEDYVRTAEALARRVGLGDRVEYRQASALELPFADAAFDGAYMMHVGMNIADKRALFSEVHRVLKPGALFAVFDVMRTADGELKFPVHWAASAETSFVATAAEYRAALAAAGFKIQKERDRGDFARAVFREAQARAAGGPPPLGVHILMKADIPDKMANVMHNFDNGLVAPTEMIARAA
jgi:ubiquinone/menaquinone biosynthesis C-methylase UbiE